MQESRVVKHLGHLATKKGRRKSGTLLVEGIRTLEELLRSDWNVHRVCVLNEWEKDQRLSRLVQSFKQKKVSIIEIRRRELNKIVDVESSQGILAEVLPHKLELKNVLGKKSERLLALDGIRDPGNMGTILRTADAFGCDGILLSRDCVELYSPKVVRAATGSLFHLPALPDLDLSDVLSELKKQGYQIVITDRDALPVQKFSLSKTPHCLVFGNEAFGIRKAIARVADIRLGIPMHKKVDSLNVAVACGIILFFLWGQAEDH